LRYFSRQHRCVTYSQRGYPPSDVPADGTRYSQELARDDAIAVMDALGIDKAHVVGHSMGAYTALHVGIRYPHRCLSVTAAGCGWGSSRDAAHRDAMKALAAETGKMFANEGIAAASAKYADAPMRQAFKHKDPRGWAEFARQLGEHSPKGQALTMRGVQMRRPSLYELVEDMKRIDVPALIVTGDEDDPCLEPALLMKRSIPNSGLVVLPRAGHTINIEEPEAFNRALFEFFTLVDGGRAAARDPRSLASGILGYRK